jgi:hypothetical protein
MKTKLAEEVERARFPGPAGGPRGAGPFGAFSLVHPDSGRRLNVIVCDGRFEEAAKLPPDHPAFKWEHVSVTIDRPFGICPTWAEMCWIKDLFWEPTECVLQYHPAKADYINIHPGCLHLWRPKTETIPIPPKVSV